MTYHFHSVLAWNKRLFHMSNANTSPYFGKQFFFSEWGNKKSNGQQSAKADYDQLKKL
jgi:hypothetical protein